ncbi:response regulator transcription factor [Streptomyces sp. Mg1]|uniref:response regulator transcription factor n=1 Tax=Streptomyces sp. Mg1 TaxID=465541 RepID=UPI002D219ECC|nr:response regulator transcription factor [Streptomyces sp. Mg1]
MSPPAAGAPPGARRRPYGPTWPWWTSTVRGRRRPCSRTPTPLVRSRAPRRCSSSPAPTPPGSLRRAFLTQAQGYVDKDGSPARLVRAIGRVAAGERSIDATLASAFMEADPMPLSPRELSVLARAAEGDSIAEIARALHLASGTVRNYMAAVTRKTGARNRIDAIRISRRAGWV